MLAFVYLIVAPSLENRLVDSRKDQVAGVGSTVVERLDVGDTPTDDFALRFASASNTRVTIFESPSRTPLSLLSIADTGGGARDQRRSDCSQGGE